MQFVVDVKNEIKEYIQNKLNYFVNDVFLVCCTVPCM